MLGVSKNSQSDIYKQFSCFMFSSSQKLAALKLNDYVESSQNKPDMDVNGKSSVYSDSDIAPKVLPNGSTMLPPFPQKKALEAPILEERDPILWPKPMFDRSIPRSKSFISQATTIDGRGSLKSPESPRAPQDIRSALNSNAVPSSTQTSPMDDYPEIDYLQLILQASTRVYDVAIETPLQYAKNLSAKLGRENKVYLKREDMQPICFSFKVRGAYNK